MTTHFCGADSSSPSCPHCGDAHICEHLALAVDLTFRDIFGGYLEKEFIKNLEAFNEIDSFRTKNFESAFNEYIDKLRQSENFIEIRHGDNIGPGLSSAYSSFYKL